jgi:hypothetical protein
MTKRTIIKVLTEEVIGLAINLKGLANLTVYSSFDPEFLWFEGNFEYFTTTGLNSSIHWQAQ